MTLRRPHHWLPRLGLLGFVAFLVFGCSASQKPVPPQLKPVSDEVRNVAFPQLREQRQKLESYRALFRARQSVAEETAVFRYAFVLKGDQRARIEALPSQGFRALSLLVKNEERAVFLLPNERKAIVTQDFEDLIARLLSVRLTTERLFYLLTGQVVMPEFEWEAAVLEEEISLGKLRLTSQSGLFISTIDAESLRLVSNQLMSPFNQQLVLRADYSDYREIDSVFIPHKIILYISDEDLHLELTAQQIRVNQEVGEHLFQVRIPKSYEIDRK